MTSSPAGNDRTIRRALVVGADGLIGKSLTGYLRARGTKVIETTRRINTTGTDRVVLDLTQPVTDWTPPQPVETAFICAAATQISFCEENADENIKINVTNMLELTRTLISRNVFTIYLSTSRVCPLHGQPLPSDQYTQQKIEAERALLALGNGVAIVRLTKVFSPDTPLIKQWRDSLAQGQAIHPFSDMTISPLSPAFVCQALERIGHDKLSGITNISGIETISYAQMARHIARAIGANEDLVQPTSRSAAGNSAGSAPAATVMDTHRMETELGLLPPDPFAEIDKTFALQPDPMT